MRLITRFEAASRTTQELRGLYRDAFNSYATAKRGSQERDNALASMQNITAELAMRSPSL